MIVKHSKRKIYLWQILIAESVGALSAFLSRSGMTDYQATVHQPGFTPPPILFPIVWTILYALMGVSAGRILLADISTVRHRSLNLYVVQLIVNFFWSLIFFNTRQFGAALLWIMLLWLLVLAMILNMRKADYLAGFMQLPYLLWLTFAVLLNYAVWKLN